MILSLDTETTGLDLYHGAKPFFVTMCFEDGEQSWWEWDVDPETRTPVIPEGDIRDIADIVAGADTLVLQNTKFDYTALRAADPRLVERWDWSKVRDTLLAGHLLASNLPHNLTAMAIQYLGVDIEPYERALKKECDAARRMARSRFKDIRIAKAGLEEMPSAKQTVWKNDTWLPRQLAERCWEESAAKAKWEETLTLHGPDSIPEAVLAEIMDADGWEYRPADVCGGNHPWRTVTRDYANADSAVTLPIWQRQEEEIRRRHLDKIYAERLKCLRVAVAMETRGVTANACSRKKLSILFSQDLAEAESTCVNIAASVGYELDLPRSTMNNSLREYVFGVRDFFGKYAGENARALRTKAGQPAFDKSAREYYLQAAPEHGKDAKFLKAMSAKSTLSTALSYMDSYERFWQPLYTADGRRVNGWYVLHPSLNPTGTATLRWSSSNPNEQNISKQEGFNLRMMFGPAPGREWYSLDAKNIEMRIPAFDAPEPEWIKLFERPKDAPYYGSVHLLNFHTVYPELWDKQLQLVGVEKVGAACKKLYEATWYRRTKMGGFAKIYGAQPPKVDSSFGRAGANSLLDARFSGMAEHNRRCIRNAEKYGYVETMPDRNVDPERGYPVMCTRTERGRILPTVPLNYRTQSTAMWWMLKAMIRVSDFFDRLNRGEEFAGRSWPGGYYIALQVHDELVPDMPSGHGRGKNPWDYNAPIVAEVKRLMELGGDDIGVPTPVGIEYHSANWSEGVSL